MQKKIYLVEDDDGIREMLELILSSSYKVMVFATLRLFHAQMQQALPDLIIMDIMLPDGNGDEAGLSLQDNESTCRIPVLFMSANTKFNLLSEWPLHDFISKPFDVGVFRQKIADLLEASVDSQPV